MNFTAVLGLLRSIVDAIRAFALIDLMSDIAMQQHLSRPTGTLIRFGGLGARNEKLS